MGSHLILVPKAGFFWIIPSFFRFINTSLTSKIVDYSKHHTLPKPSWIPPKKDLAFIKW
jgi:hypothetical protein